MGKTVSAIENKGYQTATQVTEITRTTISTTKITANKIEIKDTSDNLIFSAISDEHKVTMGGWTVDNNSLYTTGNALYLGTTGISASIGGTSVSNLVFKAGSNFGVTSGGNLYASAGKIANWIIGTNSLYTGTNSTTKAPTLYLGTGNISTSIAIGTSTQKTDWRLKISSKFGVDSTGVLYAQGAQISGKLIANDGGSIGNWNISDNKIVGGGNTDDRFKITLQVPTSYGIFGTSGADVLIVED
jgi:hypothetical protein